MKLIIRVLAPNSWQGAIGRSSLFAALIAAVNVLFTAWLGPYIPGGPRVYQVVNAVTVSMPFLVFFFAVMLYQVRLQQRLSFLSRKDGLTGLNNRFSFFEIAEQRNKQIRTGILLVLDADRFKLINDTYGHQAGDNCLKSIACTLKRDLREGDVIGRIGGEEFAVLLANANVAQARVIGERLTRPISFYAGPEDQYLTATLSVGAVVTSPDIPLDILFARADRALYKAKTQGRARVVFATDAQADDARVRRV
ncbi:GGDEF domain-containing protein [Yoonia sp.]|uniref:GGDEF domain-containing protein n=1 Tax=Yoonia sp. TaxID=2212373 RepID=UPI00391A6ED6